MKTRLPLAVAIPAFSVGLATVAAQGKPTVYLVATAHLDSHWN